MKPCSLCRNPLPEDELDRLCGLDVCGSCLRDDPSAALSAQGVASDWDVAFGRFNASLHLPGVPADFRLSCGPELLHHKVVKLLSHEVEVGDPVFDDQVYVRTSDPERAAALLAHEGVQSALLALLTGLRVNDLLGNQVTLEGPTLTVATHPLGSLDQERILQCKRDTAALAVHLRALLAATPGG